MVLLIYYNRICFKNRKEGRAEEEKEVLKILLTELISDVFDHG